MKRTGSKTPKISALGLALTWDGSRWPTRKLPAKARFFLQGTTQPKSLPSPSQSAELFASDAVREIRICWVPCLQGGDEVLSDPFPTMDGKRLAYHTTKTIRFGDILGVIYRRKKNAKL